MIKGSSVVTVPWDETVAKQKMTPEWRRFKSYLDNSFAYWRSAGVTFPTLDTDVRFQLSITGSEYETRNESDRL